MNSRPENNGQKKPQAQPDYEGDQGVINAILAASGQPTKTDLGAAVLEQALRHEAGQRKTERFFWIFALIGMIDVLVGVVNAWALTMLVPFELILLLGLANWLDVDFVKRPLQQLFERHIKRE